MTSTTARHTRTASPRPGPLRVLITVLALVAATAVSALTPSPAAGSVPAGWDEQFSTGLDPGWTPYPGQRFYYPGVPANQFQVLSNGTLYYGLSFMTHMDGYLNGNQQLYDGGNAYDPGASITREITGDYWQLEAKGSFYMPFSNGRALGMRVYFGDGSDGTLYAGFTRFRDGPWGDNVPQNSVWLQLQQKTGTAYVNAPQTTAVEPTVYVPSSGDYETFWFRLLREGGVLTASWSSNGSTWTQGWSHDLGTALDGLVQNVFIGGHSWASPAGSSASWDYVTLTMLDSTAPTVTVEQAVGQADPTNALPVHFTASFSEAVTGFTAADVELSGTAAAGATVEVTDLGGDAYDVAVSGLTSDGTLTAAIPASAVTDLAGNPSDASTSTDGTVTYDTTGPAITAPSALTADATSSAGAVVSWTATATDAVSGTVPVTCVPTSGTTFGTGDTTVVCSAADTAGNTSQSTFVVHVRGAEEQLALLRDDVVSARLPAATSSSLLSKLDRALAYLQAGRTPQALSALDSFVDQATSLRNNKKYRTVAAALLEDALRIRGVIG